MQAQAEDGEAVLAVEDNGIGIAADMLPRLFDRFVQEKQALALALALADRLDAAGETGPQVALLDIGLPGLNGYALTAELRRRGAFRDTDFVAISGYGQPDDRTRSQAAGFAAHVVKPPAAGSWRPCWRRCRSSGWRWPAACSRHPRESGDPR